MSKPFEEGQQALYKYQGVKYFHFPVPPGISYVLAADPWSFLQSQLYQRITGKRGLNKQCFIRALYFSRLAQDFYVAAEQARFPIKGTLSYYSALNLVKSFLSVRGLELEKEYEHHGMTLPLHKVREIQISKSQNGVSIFGEFARELGTPILGTHNLSLDTIISHIPELHEMAYTLKILPWSRRKFLPIEIEFLINESKDRLFTEMSYEKKNESRVETSRFYRGEREAYFIFRGEKSGRLFYRSKKRKHLSKSNFPSLYKNIQKDYMQFNLCSILNRTGYKYYCDLRPGGLSPLCYTTALLFYIGSIARYRPSETEGIQGSPMSTLINEALAVLPKQFLYQLVSMITESVCVVPQSKLD